MKKLELNRFNKLYEHHLRSLKLQGKAENTIDAYSRAVRRVRDYFNCCPDKLKPEQLEKYFADLVDSHSWSTVKIDRCGLQFFWKYVLKLNWKWVDIVKPPQVKTIPDVFTPAEIEKLIATTRKLRYAIFDAYEVFILCGRNVLRPTGTPEKITAQDILLKYCIQME